MGVSIPNDYDIDITSLPTINVGSVGPVGPVTIDGIPSSYDFDVDVNISHLPKIELSIDPITINPLDISVSIKEIPSIRAHIPANFSLGFSLFGYEWANIRLCGEAQLITEPYKPNPCEICGVSADTPGTSTQQTVLNLLE